MRAHYPTPRRLSSAKIEGDGKRSCAGEASAGGGMVTVKISGDLVIKSVTIDPEAIDPEDAELLQDLVVAATNEAIRAAQSLAESRLGGLAGGLGGLGIPGM